LLLQTSSPLGAYGPLVGRSSAVTGRGLGGRDAARAWSGRFRALTATLPNPSTLPNRASLPGREQEEAHGRYDLSHHETGPNLARQRHSAYRIRACFVNTIPAAKSEIPLRTHSAARVAGPGAPAGWFWVSKVAHADGKRAGSESRSRFEKASPAALTSCSSHCNCRASPSRRY
jgi:hypothetical protein